MVELAYRQTGGTGIGVSVQGCSLHDLLPLGLPAGVLKVLLASFHLATPHTVISPISLGRLKASIRLDWPVLCQQTSLFGPIPCQAVSRALS